MPVSISIPTTLTGSSRSNPDAWEEASKKVFYCVCCGAPLICVPRLVCTDCGEELPIKAYVFQRHGLYYAECLSLNLISRGNTQEEAILRLQASMISYVYTVLGDGAQSTKGLLPRPAPLSSWLRYRYFKIKEWIVRMLGHDYPLATRSLSKLHGDEIRIVHC